MEESAAAVRPLRTRLLLRSRGLQLILLAGIVALGLGRGLAHVGGVEALRERFGLAAAAIVAPLQAWIAFVPLLGEMLALSNAVLFGFWLGSAVSWVAWMLNAWLQYALVRRTARDLGLESRLAQLPAWLRRFPVEHPLFLIGARIPFGGPLVNTAAGVYGVPLWRHTWCAAVSIAPRVLFFSSLALGWLRL